MVKFKKDKRVASGQRKAARQEVTALEHLAGIQLTLCAILGIVTGDTPRSIRGGSCSGPSPDPRSKNYPN